MTLEGTCEGNVSEKRISTVELLASSLIERGLSLQRA